MCGMYGSGEKEVGIAILRNFLKLLRLGDPSS